MRSLLQTLALMGANAVPAVGWFVDGWSSGTLLVIYWFENVVASLFIAARIIVHRRFAPCRGHFKYEPRKDARRGPPGSFLAGFLTISLVFSAGHGFFLAVIVFMLTHNGHGAEVGVDWHEVLAGCASVLTFLAVSLAVDLPSLRKRPFFWIEQMADRHIARVIIVHLSLIFGLLAVALTNATRSFFAVFVGFKTLNDLATALPQWDPEEPPRWLCRLMDRVPNLSGQGPKNETFAEFWKRDKADEITRRRRNEQGVAPAGS